MDEKDLKDLLDKSNAELDAMHQKATTEMRSLGAIAQETKDALAKLRTEHESAQKQLDALDAKIQARNFEDTAEVPLIEALKENEDLARIIKNNGTGRATILLKGHHAAAVLERKTTLTSDNVGATPRQTTGVLQIERDPGITAEARRQLVIRDLLASRPTQRQVIDYVKVSSA